MDRLYFHYEVDCEPLRDKSPVCGGPSSWQISEKVIQRFRETFKRYDMVKGAGFYLTPEAAKAHSDLFREMKEEGFEIGVQPNVPGFRFPEYKYDLGYYDEATQRQIIAEVLEDFGEALGFRPYTYVPCCGSKNEHTYPLLVEFGFRQAMAPVAFRYFPDRPDRCTVGSFPYPHWASPHGILPGCLPLLVIPVTGELSLQRGGTPLDLRPEREPGYETYGSYRRIVNWNIELMRLIRAPIKAIVAAGHNTECVHFENVEYVMEYVFEAAEKAGMELVPAQPPDLRKVAEELGGPEAGRG